MAGFLTTFDSLKNQNRISQSAVVLPSEMDSVMTKLRVAEKRLFDLLSIKEWVQPSASLSNATSTGSTIAPTYPIISPYIEVSGNVDDFFNNLTSAFEMFGQVINLVYIDPPLHESLVTFYNIVALMKTSKPNVNLTTHLNSFTNSQWFRDTKAFRRRCYHRRKILWEISMKVSSLQATVFPQVVEILIPDNPYSNNPTHVKKRSIMNFCLPLFQSSLNAIDQSFGIIDVEVKNANKIPV